MGRKWRMTAFMALVGISAVFLLGEEPPRAESPYAYSGSDMACGPRCLWALMQITKVGQTQCDIPCIYRLIGKKLSTPTNMKDLADAAEKLGFRARGYKLGVAGLKKLESYAILPLGRTAGTKDQPLHFILVAGITGRTAVVVNTRKLTVEAFPLAELLKDWNGKALVIFAREAGEHLPKPEGYFEQLARISVKPDYQRIIDLGTFEVGATVEHSVSISDALGENSDYKIVGKNCHCVDAEIKTKVGGEKTVLVVRLHVDKPGLRQAAVAVAPKGKAVPLIFRFQMYGKDAFEIKPLVGYFQAENGLVEYPVSIKYYPSDINDVNSVAVFEGLETDIVGLKSGTATVTKSTEGKMQVFAFDITLLYDAGENQPNTTITGKATFVFKTSDGKRSVPFELTIKAGRPLFRLIPRKLFLVHSKSASRPTRKSVRVELISAAQASGLTLQPSASLPIRVESKPVSDRQYVVNVDVLPERLQGMAVGLQKGKIAINVKGLSTGGPIDLPVSLVISE